MSQTKENIPEGWVETTLGEVATFQRGFDLRKTDREEGEYPVIVSNGEDGTHRDCKVLGPGIVTGRSGSLGSIFLVKKDFWPLNTTLWIKDFHNNDVEFLYYFLKTFPFEKYNSGSGVPTLNRNHIHPLPIIITKNNNEQKAIAKVLTAFDDKIENLRAQNETLEQTAKTIFTEWFEKYQIGDELPEGWKIGKLGMVTKICGGTTPSTKNPDFWDGDIHWTSPKDLSNSKEMFLLSTEKKITKAGLKKISSGLLPKKTLLLSSRAPIGYLSFTNVELAINQGYIALLANQYLSNQFMYLWLNKFMKVVENAGNGSTFLEISKTSFRNIDCIIPEKNILKDFDNLIKPLFDKILSNLNQIKSLSQTRDTLLPKLMSGELRVNEFKV
ncbi:MAG: restriction endonuclease subunit S [Gelidibacter sp.]